MVQQKREVLSCDSASNVSGKTSCPICGSMDMADFFDIGELPVHVSVLLSTPVEARHAPTGRIVLAYCRRCSFIHNRFFEPDKVVFEPGYEASLINSQVFRSFIENLGLRLIDRYDLRNKTVLEIGCGEGVFLRLLCRLGENRGIGIDPTIKQEGTEQIGRGSIRLIRDYFSDRHADLISDFICCLSVFEDIPDPLNFLKNLREMIGPRSDVVLYFEVPNASYAFMNEATWSIYYEQCNHFTQDTLANLFERAGFEVLDANACYEDGQYVYVEATPCSPSKPIAAPSRDTKSELPKELQEFATHHREKVAIWRERLKEIEHTGQRVVTWGSGGKGIGFLNLLKTESPIHYVVDINGNRQGKYLPGTAQKVVPPEFIIEYRPDLVIITNPLYEKEIRRQVSVLGVSCNFMVA